MIKLAYERYHTFAFRGVRISIPESHDYVAVDKDGIITSFAHQPILCEDSYYIDNQVSDESPLDWTPFCIGRDESIARMVFFKQRSKGSIELIPLDSMGEYVRCLIEGVPYAIKHNHQWAAFDGDGALWSFALYPYYDKALDAWIADCDAALVASDAHRVDGLYKIIQLPNGIYEGERHVK